MRTRRNQTAFGIGLMAVLAVVVAASLGAGGAGANPSSVFALPRAQTLYTTGRCGGRTATSTRSRTGTTSPAPSASSTRRRSATTR